LWYAAVIQEADADKRAECYERLVAAGPSRESAYWRALVAHLVPSWDAQTALAFEDRVAAVHADLVQATDKVTGNLKFPSVTLDDVRQWCTNLAVECGDRLTPARGRFLNLTSYIFLGDRFDLSPYLYHIRYLCTWEESGRHPSFVLNRSLPRRFMTPENGTADSELELTDVGQSERLPLKRVLDLTARVAHAWELPRKEGRKATVTITWLTVEDPYKETTTHYFVCPGPDLVLGPTSIQFGDLALSDGNTPVVDLAKLKEST
jgi:hypothetical protein